MKELYIIIIFILSATAIILVLTLTYKKPLTPLFPTEASERWVVGGGYGTGNGNIAWSDDGLEWTLSLTSSGENPFGNDGYAQDIYYEGGLWLAGGKDGADGGKNIWWSNDGKTWTENNGQVFGTNTISSCYKIIKGGDLWVAVGIDYDDGTQRAYWSENGKSWTVGTGLPDRTNTIKAIDYNGSRWVIGGTIITAVETTFYYSDDGKDWTVINTPGGSIFGFTSIVEEILYENNIWVACGLNVGTPDEQVWWSENGADWYAAESNPLLNTCAGLGYHDGLWVVGGTSSGGSNLISYSTDGKNWTAASGTYDSTNAFIQSIITPSNGTNQRWIAVGGGASGTASSFYSDDGITWVRPNVSDLFPNSEGGTDGYFFVGKGGETKVLAGGQWNDGATETLYRTNEGGKYFPSGNPFTIGAGTITDIEVVTLSS